MPINVQVIEKIDEKDYPDWVQAYIITVNGKLRYAWWQSTGINMLYVDGYNTRYDNQWDVISSYLL